MASFYPDINENLSGRNDARGTERRSGESRRRGGLNPWKIEIDLKGRQSLAARSVLPRRYRSERRDEEWLES